MIYELPSCQLQRAKSQVRFTWLVLSKCNNRISFEFADLWRPRRSRYCVYIWSKYFCRWNKHYNSSQVYRWNFQFLLCFNSPISFYLADLWDSEIVSFWSLITILLVSDDDLLDLRQSKGKHAQILSDMCKFYRDWHVKSDGVYGTPLLLQLPFWWLCINFSLPF